MNLGISANTEAPVKIIQQKCQYLDCNTVDLNDDLSLQNELAKLTIKSLDGYIFNDFTLVHFINLSRHSNQQCTVLSTSRFSSAFESWGF